MEWTYGKAMVEQGDLESLDTWNDKKEIIYSFFDKVLDYLWIDGAFDGEVTFIDRCYSNRIYDCLTNERIEAGIATLHFTSYDDIMGFIKEHHAVTFINHLAPYMEV